MPPPSPVVTVRSARDADGAAIAALLRKVFADYPTCIFLDEEFPELAAPAGHYAAKGGALWVVEASGTVRGSLAIHESPAPGTYELAKVYLARDLRGRGVARTLLDTAIGFARARGGTRLELFTDTRFVDGHRFYERNGFRRLPGERWLGTVDRTWEYHYERWL